MYQVFHGNATASGDRTGSNGVSEASDIRRAMNGMDEKGVEEMRQLILARKAAGTTIILSSHNIEDIRILCDQVYRIDAGVVMRK